MVGGILVRVMAAEPKEVANNRKGPPWGIWLNSRWLGVVMATPGCAVSELRFGAASLKVQRSTPSKAGLGQQTVVQPALCGSYSEKWEAA